MCGIAGLFLPRGAGLVEADLEAMMAAMRHRGPDGEGRYVSDDRRYQTGFVRLAIIDLETGDQPIVERNGARVLTGNGEIYNYRELRRDFSGYPYQTQGDMESALAAYARQGEAFVHGLNGMYGLALYDRDADTCLLVRDRLGVKPLYWTRLANGGVLYASEIKALFASGLVTASVNEEAVSAYLGHGYVPSPMTLYRDINKLPPGHLLKARGNGDILVERYWAPSPAADIPTGADDIRDHLTGILSDSIRLQLRSDVPVGALLSGGIDSGLMVALAAGHSEKPLNTFTVRFEGSEADEAPLAEKVAERYGTRHQVLDLPPGEAANYLPGLAWYCDEPLYDAALLPNFLIERVLGEHVTVGLNGTGGDELFAGYGRYFQLPVEENYLQYPGWLRRRVVEPIAETLCPMLAWKLRRADKFDADRGGYLFDHTTHFPEPVRRLIGNRQAPPRPAQCAAFGQFDGPAATGALYAELLTYLPEDLLTLLDRTSMATGVEGRVPFLDHRLVEAALAVPPEIRTPGNQQKHLERKMAEAFLPEEILSAPKQGFASPVPAWMKAGMGPLAERILTRPQAIERGWWSAEGIRRLAKNPDRHGFRLYTLLMLELAVRIHVEGAWKTAPTDPLEAFADG